MPVIPEEYHTPCAACGADLRFGPGQRRLVCAHCGHAQQIADPDAPTPAPWGPRPGGDRRAAAGLHEIDLARGLAEDIPPEEWESHRTAHCPSCGAEVDFGAAGHSAECPFCATPVVLSAGTVRQIRPQGLVPFGLSEAEARAALGKWLKGLWFAPNGLSDYARRGRRLSGVYTPFWTFDARSDSRYAGQRGDAYYVSRRVQDAQGRSRTVQERRIRWSPAQGRVARRFDDLLVLASTALPRSHTDALAPWDMSALTGYRPDYLSGFLAESYTVPLADGHVAARALMERQIERDVRADIGGDEQRIAGIDTHYSAETFKHILLPVWTAAYRYRGASYRCVINGQTGRVSGERPWSVWKIAAAVLMAAAVLGLVFYLSGR